MNLNSHDEARTFGSERHVVAFGPSRLDASILMTR